MLIGIFCILAALSAAGVCAATDAFATLRWLWTLPLSFVGSLLGLVALFFVSVCVICAFVDPDKVRDNDSKFFRGFIRVLCSLDISENT